VTKWRDSSAVSEWVQNLNLDSQPPMRRLPEVPGAGRCPLSLEGGLGVYCLLVGWLRFLSLYNGEAVTGSAVSLSMKRATRCRERACSWPNPLGEPRAQSPGYALTVFIDLPSAHRRMETRPCFGDRPQGGRLALRRLRALIHTRQWYQNVAISGKEWSQGPHRLRPRGPC
jgi:hypothetical protein